MKIAAYHIVIGNATDVGKVRERNEDYMAHFETPLGYCIVVCDGMGGSVAGAEASQNAVLAIKYYLQDEIKPGEAIPAALRDAVEFANYKLREMVRQNPALKGMGTTCVLALIKNSMMFVAHAGDSRLYLVRKKKIKQITKDHSVVQNLVDSGVLTEAEAEVSEKKNQITKAIGIFEKVEPAVTQIPVSLMYNDRILLCSDGLTGHVNNTSIIETINEAGDIQSAALQLTAKANNEGGSDNITVQLVHYTGRSSKPIHKRPYKKYAVLSAVVLIVLAACFFGYKITNEERIPADAANPSISNDSTTSESDTDSVSEAAVMPEKLIKEAKPFKSENKPVDNPQGKPAPSDAKAKEVIEAKVIAEEKEKGAKQESTAKMEETERLRSLAADSIPKVVEKEAKEDSAKKGDVGKDDVKETDIIKKSINTIPEVEDLKQNGDTSKTNPK